MLKAIKNFSGDLEKDIIELRGLSKNDLFPKKINYKVGHKSFLNFLEWNDEFVVFCDCDTDGLCGAAIAKMYLDETNNVVHYKVASRSRRGFQPEDVVEIMRDFPNASGIFTIDCGVVSADACTFAYDNNIDVFISDHHNPGSSLPRATIINPKLDDKYKGFKDFCGAGIIYLLMREAFGRKDGAIQYAAIATIADMVPLVSDNRYIAQQGIKEIRNPTKKHANINAFFTGINAFVLNERDIGWTVGPTINSASRLGREHIALKAVVMNDKEAIQSLVAINDERKALVATMYENGKESTQVSDNGVSMYLGENTPQGVIGLIAMKLHIGFGLPAMAYSVTDGKANFSLRAPKTSDFINYMKEKSSSTSGGGHDEAGGFSVATGPVGAMEIETIFHEFYATQEWSTNNIEYDINISFDNICFRYDDLSSLRPFGQGFIEPTFVSDVLFIDNGMTRNKKHKKYKVYQDAMSSEGAHFIDFDKKIKEAGRYQIAYKISYNIYLKGPQLEIIEMNKLK